MGPKCRDPVVIALANNGSYGSVNEHDVVSLSSVLFVISWRFYWIANGHPDKRMDGRMNERTDRPSRKDVRTISEHISDT